MIFDTIANAQDFNVDDDWGFFWYSPIDSGHQDMNLALQDLIDYYDDYIRVGIAGEYIETKAWAELMLTDR